MRRNRLPKDICTAVARFDSIRTLLAASVNDEMHVHQMDVISAYVQGELTDEVYMEQPEMYVQHGEESKICKLLKLLYVLKQSGRQWYKKLDGYITNNGGVRTVANPCIYVFGKDDERVIVIIYVDDLILASKRAKELKIVKSKLKSAFEIVDLGLIHDVLRERRTRRPNRKYISLTKKVYRRIAGEIQHGRRKNSINAAIIKY